MRRRAPHGAIVSQRAQPARQRAQNERYVQTPPSCREQPGCRAGAIDSSRHVQCTDHEAPHKHAARHPPGQNGAGGSPLPPLRSCQPKCASASIPGDQGYRNKRRQSLCPATGRTKHRRTAGAPRSGVVDAGGGVGSSFAGILYSDPLLSSSTFVLYFDALLCLTLYFCGKETRRTSTCRSLQKENKRPEVERTKGDRNGESKCRMKIEDQNRGSK